MTKFENAILRFCQWAITVNQDGVSPARITLVLGYIIFALGYAGNADVEALNNR